MGGVFMSVFMIDDGVEALGYDFSIKLNKRRMKTLITVFRTIGGKHETNEHR